MAAPATQVAQARPRSPPPAYEAREREHARGRASQTLQETNINCIVGNGGARVVRWPGGHYSVHATAPAASAAPASRKRTRDPDGDNEERARERVVRAKKLVIDIQTNVGSAVYGAWHTFLPAQAQAQAQAPAARATGVRIGRQTNIGSVVVNGYEDDDLVALAASDSSRASAPAQAPARTGAKAQAKAPARAQARAPALNISGCTIGAQLNFGGVVVNGGGSAVVIRRRAPGRGK